MSHLLVTQLRFTRSELLRCLQGVSDEEARCPQFVGDVSYRPEG